MDFKTQLPGLRPAAAEYRGYRTGAADGILAHRDAHEDGLYADDRADTGVAGVALRNKNPARLEAVRGFCHCLRLNKSSEDHTHHTPDLPRLSTSSNAHLIPLINLLIDKIYLSVVC